MWNWLKRLFRRKKKPVYSPPASKPTPTKQPYHDDAPSGRVVTGGKKDWNNKLWDRYLVDELVNQGFDSIVPKDYKEFNFNKSDLIGSWAKMFKGMAYCESSFKANTEYKEKFKDRNGKRVVSTGLFQTSIESLGGYGMKVNQTQLKDPKVNIKSAVTIMKKWVVRDGVISDKVGSSYRGGARYWSVLRADKRPDKIKIIRENNL